MKAPNFDFVQPSNVDEVVAVLSDKNTFIKILSGGQSLCPMMNFRLVRPELIVDISRIKSLKLVDQVDGEIKIGSGVTHSRLEDGVVDGKTGDYLKDAVWIGDNTTNQIIKARYLSGDIISETSITVINFVEDIVVNR